MEPEKLRKKINECKQNGKLNLSYMELPELSPSIIAQIKVGTNGRGTVTPGYFEQNLVSKNLSALRNAVYIMF